MLRTTEGWAVILARISLASFPCLAAISGVTPAFAGLSTSIVVNSTADVVADDGSCTLREAALAVNTQSPSGATPGECIADTDVTFALPAGSTIALLAGTPIVFERSVGIHGPGFDALTITLGAGSSRLLVFDGRLQTSGFHLSGVTLAGGEGTIAYDGALFYGIGGALLVLEPSTLFIGETRFRDNVAFFAGAALAIVEMGNTPLLQDLEFDGNLVAGAPGGGGAAIYYDSAEILQIRRALFVGNRVTNTDPNPDAESNGGAIWIPYPVGSALNLEECTFSANEATGAGGAIAFGRPTQDAGVVAQIWDTTFTGNLADTNHNSTMQSGGALHLGWNSDSTTLSNSIVAGNLDGSTAAFPAHDLVGGTAVLSSGGYNRIGVRAGAAPVFPIGLPNANHDWVGTSGSPLVPGLEPLADNGGPTRTHRPQAMLGILDQGSCSASYYDQRDWTGASGPRLFDNLAIADADDGCDIGAFELFLLPPAEIFEDDFERGDFREWSGVSGI
jgi:CSLREA domain-containing protein